MFNIFYADISANQELPEVSPPKIRKIDDPIDLPMRPAASQNNLLNQTIFENLFNQRLSESIL